MCRNSTSCARITRPGADSAARDKQRTNLEGQLDRLRVLFQLGDVTEQTYRAERDRIRGEIAELRPVEHFDLERAAQVLQNFDALWDAATLAEREEIARGMIERLYTFEGKIVAIEPKSDFYPLLTIAVHAAGVYVTDGELEPFSPTVVRAGQNLDRFFRALKKILISHFMQ